MTILIVAVFVVVYLGMAAGQIPGLAVNRAGIAFAGVVVLLISGGVTLDDLPRAVEWPTLLLMFGLMIVAGHYAAARCFLFLSSWISRLSVSPQALLGLTVTVSGLLSAVLVNDIVVFALAPLLCTGLRERGLDSRPFLLALAASSNAGSAASLIGNPQNILIGEVGRLSFLDYMQIASVPAMATMFIVYVVIAVLWRSTLSSDNRPQCSVTLTQAVEVDRWLTVKSLLATVLMIGLMIVLTENRAVAALAIAALLMLGRRVKTQTLLRKVDGSLLLMIGCLFIVTASLTRLPEMASVVTWLHVNDWLPYQLSTLVPFSIIASNTIGNVPAVVLLLQVLNDIPAPVLTALAVFSTLAGNLLLIGSLANIIVVERAASLGVRLTFGQFARTGIPITVLSILISALWFKGMGYLSC